MKIPDEVVRDAYENAMLIIDDNMRDNHYDEVMKAMRIIVDRAARWAFEEAAKVADSDVLPFSLGGDHILDRATGMTIAEAIRKLAGEEK